MSVKAEENLPGENLYFPFLFFQKKKKNCFVIIQYVDNLTAKKKGKRWTERSSKKKVLAAVFVYQRVVFFLSWKQLNEMIRGNFKYIYKTYKNY